jgi:Tol biopolymer transport system component
MRHEAVCVRKRNFRVFRKGAFVKTLLVSSFLILANLSGYAQVQKRAIKDPKVKNLYNELANKGWIVFSAKSEKGDYDLFISRPNGSNMLNITRTPRFNELGPRFFPDGKRILYRRVETIKPNVDYRDLTYGFLVIANADGSNPRTLGKEGEYPWATMSPDGKQMACLYKKEGKIRIFDLETLKMIREIPRQSIFWQLGWSRDGKQFCGVANLNGQDWNIVTYDIKSGKRTLISRLLNCTPDWFPDSRGCIYSHINTSLPSDDGGAAAKRIGQGPDWSWTMIMMADREGEDRKLVVAEQYRHLYFACVSPDNKYVIYCRLEKDATLAGPMAVIRLADTPIIDGSWRGVEEQYAKDANKGPILHLNLPPGFHPSWTYAKQKGK